MWRGAELRYDSLGLPVLPLMVDAFAMTFPPRCNVDCGAGNTVLVLVQLPFRQLFRMLCYSQQNEEEKEVDSDVTLITNTHNHAILCTSEALSGNKMILGSLATPHRRRARKSLRAAWGPNTVISACTSSRG
jgi:hypothetical protein